MPLAFVHRVVPALAFVALPGVAIAAEPKSPLANFPTAQEAQQHCPDDLVVWLDPANPDLSLSGPAVVRLDEEWSLCLPKRGGSGRDAGHAKCGLRLVRSMAPARRSKLTARVMARTHGCRNLERAIEERKR
jgi:hypothetical protein